MRDFQAREHEPPTIRQIGAAMGIRSPNGVMCNLHALKKKGFIHQTGTRWKVIEQTESEAIRLLRALVRVSQSASGENAFGELIDIGIKARDFLVKLE
jgi:SOS-response transcriptional repressor LexA